MKKISSILLFNQLTHELLYSSLKLHVEDFEHFSFHSPHYSITIHFNQLFIQSFDNNVGKNIIEFINYTKDLENIKTYEPLFNKYFKMMLYPDFESIRFTSKISLKKIKNKIFSISSFSFFNTNIDNEALESILPFHNIQNLTFKNCSFSRDCNFSKLKKMNINIEDCNIESFSIFLNSYISLKIKNTNINEIGCGTYNGQNLEIENTNIDTLFLNWNMPNLITFIYKNSTIQNELIFLGCNAKNIESIVIEGHLLSLDFLKNLSTMINLKITGDKYEESCFIHLTKEELNQIMCKYQNKLNINVENTTFIKSLQINGLTSFRYLLKMNNVNNIKESFNFWDYVKSSKFLKNDGYFIFVNNYLVFHPTLNDIKTKFTKEGIIKSEPYMYYADGHPVYLSQDKVKIENKETKAIDINRIATKLKEIITKTASQNISFDLIMELLFYEIRYFKVVFDINLLRILQEKFIDDLDTYSNLEKYINLEEQKKELREKYTYTLNDFCNSLLKKIDIFSKDEKAVILYVLNPLINSDLNVYRKDSIHLSTDIITNEIFGNRKLCNSLQYFLECVNSKTNGSFLLFQNKLSNLNNEYLKLTEESIPQNNEALLNLVK